MIIIESFYGIGNTWIDVTNQVASLPSLFKADNDSFGDPIVGTPKELRLQVLHNGENRELIFKEGEYVNKNLSDNRRAAIFYTNNKLPSELLKHSLFSLERAARFSGNVDIYTCGWEEIPQNPFPFIKANMKEGGIANMYYQIAQLVNLISTTGIYDYVSMVEHDVLYAEDYFAYDDFSTQCLYNHNNISYDEKGFHELRGPAISLHHITFKMAFAKDWFMKKLFESTRSFTIPEPIGESLYTHRKNSKPSVHVNHGNHLSTTHSFYKEDTIEVPQWDFLRQLKILK